MRPVTPKEWRDVYYQLGSAADNFYYVGMKGDAKRFERIAAKIKEQYCAPEET